MHGQADLPPSIHLKQTNKHQKSDQFKLTKKKKGKLPFGSCRRVGGARAQARWRDKWRGYRIGGRIRTLGDCGRTSTCPSNVSLPDWRRRSGTNRCRWTCSSVCRRSGTCTLPSAFASRPPHPLALLSSLAEGFGWVSISCLGPNPPFSFFLS